MSSITATPLPALGIVKILIDWTPLQLDDIVHVYRVTPDNVETEVIGSPVVLSNGEAILYDTTAPLETELYYRAEIENPVGSVDSFTRNVANTWGTNDRGLPYFPTGGPSGNWAVNGTQGVVGMGSTGVYRTMMLPQTMTDLRTEATFIAGQVSTGAPVSAYLVVRQTGTDDWYQFGLDFDTGGVLRIRVQRRDSTSMTTTTLESYTLTDTYVANTPVRVVAEVEGSRLRMKAWTTNEPDTWQVITYDNTHTFGTAGYRFLTAAGNTNTLPTLVYTDDTYLVEFTPLSIDSITPGSKITLDAGDSGRDGWIRDPQDPVRSVRLDNCSTHTFECLNAERFVFFQGLEEEEYQSATGVFPVLDSENPLTVAQTRKGISTAMRVVSTTLADIPALRSLFSSGRDLVVSLPQEYGWGSETYGSLPVTFHDIVVGRLNRRDMRKPQRVWSLPMRVVDNDLTYPSEMTGSNGIPVPGATYADMEALGLTYNQLKGSGVYDDFARVVPAGGWGTASIGPAWSVREGPAAQQSVTGDVGRMSQTQRDAPTLGTTTVMGLPLLHTDIEIKARFRWAVSPNGDTLRSAVRIREIDSNNWMELEAGFTTAPDTQLRVGQRVSGVDNYTIGHVISVPYVVSSWYWLRFRVIGTTYEGKMWAMDDPEPASWQITGTSMIGSGSWVGVKGFASVFSANPTPEILDWDDVEVTLPGVTGGRTYLEWSQGVFT